MSPDETTSGTATAPDPALARQLAALDLLQTPIWVLDLAGDRILWQNLASHSLTSGPGDSGAEVLGRRLCERLRETAGRADGMDLPARFALPAYPGITLCTASVVDTGAGRCVLVEGSPDRRSDAATRRGVEALRHTSVMISEYHATSLGLLSANPAAMDAFRETGGHLPDLFVDRSVADSALAIVQRNGQHTFQCEVRTAGGHRWHAVDLRLAVDPVSHAPMLLLTQTDITDRKELELLKDRFIASVSHELRTPLTAVRGALGLLGTGDGAQMPARSASLLELAGRNVQRLSRMVENLLALRQFELGTLDVMLQPELLVPMARDAVTAREDQATESGVRLHLDIQAPDDLRVLADRERLVQALDQLLVNATRYTVTGDTVEVGVAVHGGNATLTVRDHGPGVPEHAMEHLFARFFRADDAGGRAGGGFGLGLALARNIVERHGGTIGCENAAGGGARFHITVPVLRDSGPAGADQVD